MTTESVWVLEPRELNPHRQRWFFDQTTSLMGLEAVGGAPGTWRVRARQLRSFGEVHVRGPGRSYSDLQKFSCQPEPDSWFATREGAEEAGQAAAKLWDEALGREKARLQLQLERISAASQAAALEAGQRVFKDWLTGVEADWRGEVRSRARMAEWRFYLKAAQRAGICKLQEGKRRADVAPQAPAPTWREMIDKPGVNPAREVVARAPARLWGGMYSIRLSMNFGSHSLTGQFLIDSGSAVSLVSPAWLQSQGINPVLLERPLASPQRVSWSGGSGLAKRALPLQVSIADYALPQSDFLLMDTELFAPPQYAASCCDGILGNDFLRHFAVEFTPGKPASVAFLERKGYSQGVAAPWLEVASLPSGDLVSSTCVLRRAGQAGGGVAGARWDTGNDAILELHTPWLGELKKGSQASSWLLDCQGTVVGQELKPTAPDSQREGPDSPVRARVPGFSVGMGLLGRGPFALDLGNGRMWLDLASLDKQPLENRSGLKVEYAFAKADERELRVVKLGPGTPAEALLKAGLKPGMPITRLDGIEVADLDAWQVEERLAGSAGPTVSVEWKTPHGLKVAPLRVGSRSRD